MPVSLTEAGTCPAVLISESAPISQAARVMAENQIGCVVVIDDDRTMTGIVTDRDLVLRGLATDKGPDTPVSAVMSRDVVSVASHASSLDAARQMAVREVRRLPIVAEDGQILGVISIDDLFRAEGRVVMELQNLLDHQWSTRQRHHTR